MADAAVRREVVIANKRGLHARAAAKFCAVAESYIADIRVRHDGLEVTACSIMGLLMLGAGKGSTISISATGPQATEAVDTLCKLIGHLFGEDG